MKRLLCVFALACLSLNLVAQTQPSTAAAAGQTPSGIQQDAEKLAIEAAALEKEDPQGGDFVPCEFTTQELLSLRAAPEAAVLTGADSEALKLRIMAVAREQQVQGNPLAAVNTDSFINKLTSENFTGKTQTEALETIMEDYSSSTTPAADTPAAVSLNTAKHDAYIADLTLKGAKTNSALYTAPLDFSRPFLDVANQIRTVAPDDAAANAVAADAEAANGQKSVQQNAIVDMARQASSLFLRPKDVACAMQILTFKEAQYAYGTVVAKNYIVVQLNVRNLNAQQEFQIHDAEFAVDSDPSGRHGRFFSGSDKRVVRSFAVAQESFDSRNLTVNITDAAGSLLSSIVPIFKGSFADAVGVLTGGAIPGLGKVWKDRTTEQLNLLNDTALTPGTNGTTVPKNGVAQFMIFVPSKMFESGWWTLDCANKTYLASKQTDYLFSNRESGQTGIDVDRLLEPCLVEGASVSGAPSEDKNYSIKRVTEDPASGTSDIFRDQQPLPFKKWSGSMLNIFRELSFTAVAGVHTLEASELTPSLSKWNCQPAFDKQGNVVFDGTDPIACVVGGQNLGTITTFRLRNADNPADSADFTLQPTSGDPSTGTVKFDAPKLAALGGTTYGVLIADKDAKETKTPLAMHFIGTVNPVVLKISTGSLVDLGASPLPTVTIFGSHLDGIAKVILSSKADPKTSDTITLLKHDAFSLPLDLSSATNLKTAATKTPTDISVTLQPSDPAAKQITTTLEFQLKNSTAAH